MSVFLSENIHFLTPPRSNRKYRRRVFSDLFSFEAAFARLTYTVYSYLLPNYSKSSARLQRAHIKSYEFRKLAPAMRRVPLLEAIQQIMTFVNISEKLFVQQVIFKQTKLCCGCSHKFTSVGSKFTALVVIFISPIQHFIFIFSRFVFLKLCCPLPAAVAVCFTARYIL